MKSKYCFIRNFDQMRPGSFVYHVWVGSSAREQAKLALVREYCNDVGIYFKKWNSLVDVALTHAASPFKRDGNAFARPFKSTSITVSNLYQMIIDDSFASFEANFSDTQFGIWLNFRNDPDYIVSQSKKHCNTTALPHRRKNLSSGVLTEGKRAALAMAGVILLILLDSLFTQWFFI